jgi:hypothetical protein
MRGQNPRARAARIENDPHRFLFFGAPGAAVTSGRTVRVGGSGREEWAKHPELWNICLLLYAFCAIFEKTARKKAIGRGIGQIERSNSPNVRRKKRVE